jgi:ribosomal protein S18 acetylase RimI-like enzyme
MPIPKVRTAAEADIKTAIQALILGFSTDTIVRWCWPEPDVYISAMPDFVQAYGGKAFEAGTAYIVDEYCGTALWLPPSVEPDYGTIEEVVKRTVPESKQEDLAAAQKKLATFHPDRPYWFLPLIAVDVAWQGKGLGSALMKHAVAKCDEDGTFAYLESSNSQNISLYERYGFEVVGEVQVGSAPLFTPMIRQPR